MTNALLNVAHFGKLWYTVGKGVVIVKNLHREALLDAFQHNLRAFRQEAGLSQYQVAQHIHVSRASYAYYELGKCFPTLGKLYRLAQLFGHSMDDFFQ